MTVLRANMTTSNIQQFSLLYFDLHVIALWSALRLVL